MIFRVLFLVILASLYKEEYEDVVIIFMRNDKVGMFVNPNQSEMVMRTEAFKHDVVDAHALEFPTGKAKAGDFYSRRTASRVILETFGFEPYGRLRRLCGNSTVLYAYYVTDIEIRLIGRYMENGRSLYKAGVFTTEFGATIIHGHMFVQTDTIDKCLSERLPYSEESALRST